MIDFSRYEKNNIYYGGTERKIGISIDGFNYMLKFQKDTRFGKRYNHLSEYVGSHIFNMLEIDVHDTYLGVYDGENVVACKDFNVEGYEFVPFNDVGESSLEQDKEIYQYTYEDIMQMLSDNKKLTSVDETIDRFWDIYIVDALLGNFDRHGANWGFLKKENKYKLAPVFDNGSCLYPQLVDEEQMKVIMASSDETDKRIYTFPTSQIKLGDNKSSYFDVISSLRYKECNEALVRICQRYSQNKIDAFIDSIENISDTRKDFYKYVINQRYNKILLFSYKKLMEG